jgi:hypothetical protein
MLAARDWPRTTIVTREAKRARCIAACPAELPAPYDKDLFACASWCLAHGGAAENANSRETLEARYVQAAVGHTSCDDNCPAFYLWS